MPYEHADGSIKCVTCTTCGWVHVAYSRAEAEAAVTQFNDYFVELSERKKNDYYGGKCSSIKDYENCNCGKNDFRPTKPGDCPDGCTLNPVIYEDKSDEVS